MPWSETIVFTEDFEEYNIPVIYGTGKLYGDGNLYGGTVVFDWLRPVTGEITTYITEDFEHGSWRPRSWTEDTTYITENFENIDWLRPAWSEDTTYITEDFENDIGWLT
jgi:hypothetical protein